jgi:drug/metabolite transporter (DMT)-like permease
VLLWAALALLATGAQRVPPFELTALTFALAFVLALGKWLVRGEGVLGHLRQPASVWAVGVGGLFLYHLVYFAALKRAPAVEVSLICFLWPLFIVVLSALLPDERLRWFHVAGIGAGLAGTALLVTDGGRVAFRSANAAGYALALGCAVIWATYSVLSRRLRAVPTDAVGGFCLATSVLAGLCHFAFEESVVPDATEWLFILALGAGPVGLAFFVWDYGVKHGNLRALAGLSYGSPLLSTLLLIAFGRASPTPILFLACFLIVGGAVLAAGDLWRRASASA